MRLPTLSFIAASMSLLSAVVAPEARAQAPAAAPPPPPVATVPAPSASPAPTFASGGPARASNPGLTLSHRHQFGISVMPGMGYRIVVPYKENIDCGDASGQAGKRVCTTRTPFFLEAQGAFGVSSRIDLIVDFRFGIEGERLTKSHQFMFAPGFRIWLDNDRELKFYTTLQGVFDSTKQKAAMISDQDFGIRNANGVMYDFIRNVGFFLQFGETIGFKRWFRIEVDAGVGVQVRFP